MVVLNCSFHIFVFVLFSLCVCVFVSFFFSLYFWNFTIFLFARSFEFLQTKQWFKCHGRIFYPYGLSFFNICNIFFLQRFHSMFLFFFSVTISNRIKSEKNVRIVECFFFIFNWHKKSGKYISKIKWILFFYRWVSVKPTQHINIYVYMILPEGRKKKKKWFCC